MNATARPTKGLNHEIVKVIQEIMDRESLKNTDLSSRSGVPTSSVYRYMNEERALSLHDLEKIAKAFNLSTSSLLARAEARLSAQTSHVSPVTSRRFPSPAVAPASVLFSDNDSHAAGALPPDWTLAATDLPPDPLDTRGEESQIPPDWDE